MGNGCSEWQLAWGVLNGVYYGSGEWQLASSLLSRVDDGSNEGRWCTAAPASLAFAAVVHSCSDGPDPEVATVGETVAEQSAQLSQDCVWTERTIISNCVWTEAHHKGSTSIGKAVMGLATATRLQENATDQARQDAIGYRSPPLLRP